MSIKEPRGFHAHKELNQVMIVQQGSVRLDLFRGSSKKTYMITSFDDYIYIPSGSWREIYALEEGTTVLVIADQIYKETDYIRSWDKYLLWFESSNQRL